MFKKINITLYIMLSMQAFSSPTKPSHYQQNDDDNISIVTTSPKLSDIQQQYQTNDDDDDNNKSTISMYNIEKIYNHQNFATNLKKMLKNNDNESNALHIFFITQLILLDFNTQQNNKESKAIRSLPQNMHAKDNKIKQVRKNQQNITKSYENLENTFNLVMFADTFSKKIDFIFTYLNSLKYTLDNIDPIDRKKLSYIDILEQNHKEEKLIELIMHVCAKQLATAYNTDVNKEKFTGFLYQDVSILLDQIRSQEKLQDNTNKLISILEKLDIDVHQIYKESNKNNLTNTEPNSENQDQTNNNTSVCKNDQCTKINTNSKGNEISCCEAKKIMNTLLMELNDKKDLKNFLARTLIQIYQNNLYRFEVCNQTVLKKIYKKTNDLGSWIVGALSTYTIASLATFTIFILIYLYFKSNFSDVISKTTNVVDELDTLTPKINQVTDDVSNITQEVHELSEVKSQVDDIETSVSSLSNELTNIKTSLPEIIQGINNATLAAAASCVASCMEYAFPPNSALLTVCADKCSYYYSICKITSSGFKCTT